MTSHHVLTQLLDLHSKASASSTPSHFCLRLPLEASLRTSHVKGERARLGAIPSAFALCFFRGGTRQQQGCQLFRSDALHQRPRANDCAFQAALPRRSNRFVLFILVCREKLKLRATLPPRRPPEQQVSQLAKL